ncbi:MAG: hypothetical protein EBZ93_13730, partial [Actinobacteria bacterium]|nr:hypothetical protein [Actinomycetota bacterium]
MAGDEGNRQFLDVECLAVTHGQCQWLVVRAPRDDRRVMTEQVDGFGGLIGQVLCTERPWPPQSRPLHVDVPLDVVRTVGESALLFVGDHAVHIGRHTDWSIGIAVEAGVQANVRTGLVGIAAQN